MPSPIKLGNPNKQSLLERAMNVAMDKIVGPLVGDEGADQSLLANNLDMQRLEMERCKGDIIYWCSHYIWTYDPRIQHPNPKDCLFVPYARQEELIHWAVERRAKKQVGLCVKSRDSGVSILFGCILGLHSWLFEPGFSGGYGSSIEDKVDRLGDMSSLLEKIRYAIRHLPQWMKPKGLKEDKHLLHRRLINPANDSLIIAEIGDQCGRGGRTSTYAQPLDAKILTPTCWANMGDLSVGDNVVGSDGKPSRVLAIHKHGVQQIYRVDFSDGAAVECTGSHLWTVSTPRNKGKVVTLTTDGLRQQIAFGGSHTYYTHYKYVVPTVSPVEFADPKLPLEPYLMGVMLGDGDCPEGGSSPRICMPEKELAAIVAKHLPAGVRLSPSTRGTYRLVLRQGKSNPVLEAMKSVGLNGVCSFDKFIPESYKFSSAASRMELLSGLMDTDGCATLTKAGTLNMTFVSCSISLCRDVQFLARSLGGTAKIYTKPGGRVVTWKTGKTSIAKECYHVNIKMRRDMCPFKLSRKRAKFWQGSHIVRQKIISITEVGHKESQCITIDSPDHLYVTNDFILTHNCIDEAAFLDHPDLVEASLAANTDCVYYVSTPNGVGNFFHTKRMSLPAEQVFEYRWDQDPRKTTEWKEKILREYGKTVFEREYNLNFAASLEGICIPADWVKAAVGLDLPPIGDMIVGFDVAAEGDDLSVLCPRRGPKVYDCISWKGKNTTQSAYMAVEHCEKLGAVLVAFDAVGMGEGIKGTWDAMASNDEGDNKLPFQAIPIVGGDTPTDFVWADGKTSKEKFVNLRAEAWWALRVRFERTYEHVLWLNGKPGGKMHPIEDLISLPVDSLVLQSELSTPLVEYNERGKVRLESKVKMRSRGIHSPDYADALALAFTPAQVKRKFWWV